MSIDSLKLTPAGVVVADGNGALAQLFMEGEAAGLLSLASTNLPEAGTSAFWRGVVSEFLRVLCHVPDGAAVDAASLPPPTSGWLAEKVLNAPPMSGGEYLSPDVLLGLWQRLLDWTATETEACGGVAGFLSRHAARWTKVGRVCVHLAEHKGDSQFPFAFLATYISGLTLEGKPRRLPLGRALEEYAGAQKKTELVKLLTPLHEAAKRSALMADLVATGDVFHPLVWTPEEAHDFLREIPLYEEAGLVAQLPNWWRKRRRARISVTIEGNKKSALTAASLLDFKLGVALGEEELSPAEIEELRQSDANLVRLRGEWVEVDRERLQDVLAHWNQVRAEAGSNGISFLQGMRLLAGAPIDLGDAPEDNERDSWLVVRAGGELRQRLMELRNPTNLDAEAPRGLRATLRPYQLAGVNWLWLCAGLGLGACLADDMGLGKTIQVLAALLRRKEQAKKNQRPSLLVVPASLLGNWKTEAEKFASGLRLFFAHPAEATSEELEAAGGKSELRGTDLVVTTYGMLARLEWLTRHEWDWVVLDEAQAIKNPATLQTKTVKKLRGTARMVLTGTPVENRLGDLWSLFDFLNPGLLGSTVKFRNYTKQLGGEYASLRRLIAPYILRRTKRDPTIAPDLPEKTEMQVFCGLTKTQATLYQQTVSELSRALEQDESNDIRRKGLVLGALMRFKQICNHPSHFTGDGGYDPRASGKFMRLGELCEEISSRGEKVLVFTQFRELCAPLAGFLSTVFGSAGLILHGGTPVKTRRNLVTNFQREGGPPFFVLSIKAGGTGLNLTAAAHVIHFDRWWNPAVENQATDRAFRIGQQKNVLVHKFVTRGTMEEKIDKMIQDKQALADDLLAADGAAAMTDMSDEEIMRMIVLDLDRAAAH